MNLWLRKNRGKIKCICIDAGVDSCLIKKIPVHGALPQENTLTLGIALKLGKMISNAIPGYSNWCIPDERRACRVE